MPNKYDHWKPGEHLKLGCDCNAGGGVSFLVACQFSLVRIDRDKAIVTLRQPRSPNLRDVEWKIPLRKLWLDPD